MTRKPIPTRLLLTEWLYDHPDNVMVRSWELDERTRRRVIAYLQLELGPATELLAPLSAVEAMAEAVKESDVTIWRPDR